MTNVAIRIQDLSKQYKLNLGKPRHNTLRDQISYGMTRMLRGTGKDGA
jgi:hypothetical protein